MLHHIYEQDHLAVEAHIYGPIFELSLLLWIIYINEIKTTENFFANTAYPYYFPPGPKTEKAEHSADKIEKMDGILNYIDKGKNLGYVHCRIYP